MEVIWWVLCAVKEHVSGSITIENESLNLIYVISNTLVVSGLLFPEVK